MHERRIGSAISPAHYKRRLVLVSAREHSVYLSQSLVGFVRAFTPSPVALLKDEIENVPFVWRSPLCEGTGVDLGSGVFFHPFRGGMLASFVIPVADVDEGVLGWERHCWGNCGFVWGS
jgi:hypothetical protein